MPNTGVPTGEQIRRAREARRMTQAELAELLGVGLRTVGRWERAESVPRSAVGALVQILDLNTAAPERDPSDPVATALAEASDLQILAEIARRIQAGRDPHQPLPDVPQVDLRWPRSSAPSAHRLSDRDAASGPQRDAL